MAAGNVTETFSTLFIEDCAGLVVVYWYKMAQDFCGSRGMRLYVHLA